MIQQVIKKKVNQFMFNRSVFKPRYNDGARDLNKALQNVSQPMTLDKKAEVLDFWNPVLEKGRRWAKKAFDIRWFDVYNTTNVDGHTLKYYMPDNYFYCIVDARLSNSKEAVVVDDKNMYDLYFPEIKQPMTLGRIENGLFLNRDYNLVTIDYILAACKEQERVIIKPAIGACAGAGIVYWDSSLSSTEELRNILMSYQYAIIQSVAKQHKVLADFNDSSVNTLRIVTLIFNGEVRAVSSVVIMGAKGAKTNHLHRGGLVCGILDDGQLRSTAFDGKLNRYEKHPSGIRFADVKIPNYDKCIDVVKKMAPRFCKVSKLISWDITLDTEGNPLLIETNLSWGGLCQTANGPIFGNLTPEVLDYVNTIPSY